MTVCAAATGAAQDGTGKTLLDEALVCEKTKDYPCAFELYMKYEAEHNTAPQAVRGMSRTARRADRFDAYRDLLRKRFYQYPADQVIGGLYIDALSPRTLRLPGDQLL